MGTDRNTIKLAPDFNPHRVAVAANESLPVTNKAYGVNAKGMDMAILDISLVSGTLTSVAINIMYWSDKSAQFVSPTPAETQTFTAPSQATIGCVGRTFFVQITSLVGVAPVVSVDVAGVADGSGQ